MLTNQDVEDAIIITTAFLDRSKRFLCTLDESRGTCQICHTRRREFEWFHWGNARCKWHHVCHRCFLKIKHCPFCGHDTEKRR